MNFKVIKARSGKLSVSGDATLANRRIEAELAVDLVDGIVGVLLVIYGPTGNVQLSVPKGAVAGAVVGTALLPGIGTAIGARVGAAVGKFSALHPHCLQASGVACTHKFASGTKKKFTITAVPLK